MRLTFTLRAWILGLTTAMAFTASAQAMQSVDFSSKMEVEKVTTDADGKATTRYVPTEIVVPGDRIRFTLQLINKTENVAQGLKIIDPLPPEIRFESTVDSEGFSVSVDGGENYGALEALTIPVEGAPPRAASIEEITHLRWILDQPLAPGATKTVTFLGIVR